MKTTKKLLALILVMITVFGCFSMCITASAAETTEKTICLLKKTHTTLDKSTFTYRFTAPETSKVYMTIYRGNNTYGKFKVTIKGSDNTVYAQKEFNYLQTEADKDQRIYMDLEKGDYKILIKGPEKNYSHVEFAVWEKLTKNYPTKSLKLNRSSVTINYDTEKIPKLVATQNPKYTNDKITWTSSNKKVATVKDGVIEPLNLGTTIITAKSGTKTAKCTVNIKSLLFIVDSHADAQYLKKYVKYVDNAEGGKWTSSDKNVGTVSSTGKFTPKNPGTCVVNFKTADGKYYKIYVLVTGAVMLSDYGYYKNPTSHGAILYFTNFTEKVVSKVKVRFTEYDYNYKVIKSNYRYLSNKTIEPFETEKLKCKVGDSTAYFDAHIAEVQFTDGTIVNYSLCP